MKSVVRVFAMVLLSGVALQLYFAARVALMAVVDPQSTTFQRSEIWRLVSGKRALVWHQQWTPYAHISPNLKRAVIASEDTGFAAHGGVEWDALEKAWGRHQRAESRVDEITAGFGTRDGSSARDKTVAVARAAGGRPPRVVGGSTITQQLAKNLFLAGERNGSRKAQEFTITLMLEACLSKQRILEIYLNNVEWGEGVFGAEAAARRYFRVDASGLAATQAAQLAVMLPAPKRFEKRPASLYVLGRAATIGARMSAVALP